MGCPFRGRQVSSARRRFRPAGSAQIRVLQLRIWVSPCRANTSATEAMSLSTPAMPPSAGCRRKVLHRGDGRTNGVVAADDQPDLAEGRDIRERELRGSWWAPGPAAHARPGPAECQDFVRRLLLAWINTASAPASIGAAAAKRASSWPSPAISASVRATTSAPPAALAPDLALEFADRHQLLSPPPRLLSFGKVLSSMTTAATPAAT